MQQCQQRSRSFALFPGWANFVGWAEVTAVSAIDVTLTLCFVGVC